MSNSGILTLNPSIGTTLCLDFPYNHRAQASADFHGNVVQALIKRYRIQFIDSCRRGAVFRRLGLDEMYGILIPDSNDFTNLVSTSGSAVRIETTQRKRYDNQTSIMLRSPGVWQIIKEMRAAKVQDLAGLVKFLGIESP